MWLVPSHPVGARSLVIITVVTSLHFTPASGLSRGCRVLYYVHVFFSAASFRNRSPAARGWRCPNCRCLETTTR
ncbi:hypothetical protein EX30DRAFT_219702 [Ascodesmis nigricans]|uniref:Uncharacterized protein n=1 Tax=Ascodesmis nigricans TaxID=341454 RepID=A0A4S2N051_9PEZI|nr:hypothetical protein EX30DRAFT_219702 [Ascodesmis nigricans]